MRPILYKGNLVFPVGTLDIADMVDEDLDRIGTIAKPFIDKYGAFVSIKQIKELMAEVARVNITLNDFYSVMKSNKIEYVKIGGSTLFNLFQVVRAYENELSSRH
jgi:hypothetical protein